MTSEPQRLQYLSAMGVTAWVARYRLPNAKETPACDWPTPETPETPAPSQRLHALLDEVPARSPASAPETPAPAKPPRRGKARALLGVADEPVDTSETESDKPPAAAGTGDPQQALRFSLQIAALEGRWLVLLPQGGSPDAVAQRLLGNLLQAAGIHLAQPPVFQAFHWPMMEELPVEAPLDEARDGLRAFLDGRRRGGWRPERVLLFGESPVLAEVLSIEAGHCDLLQLPAWQGASLTELSRDAAAKRALLPLLGEWREAWLGAADGPAANEAADE